MRLASVILDIPTQSLDCAYTYGAPTTLTGLEVGCAVLVSFRHRQALGYVVGLEEVEGSQKAVWEDRKLDPQKLKNIQQVLSHSYFDAKGAACAQFLSDTYIAPLSSCVRLFTPPGGVPRIVRNGSGWCVKEPAIGPVDDRWVRLGSGAVGFTPQKNAIKQISIIAALQRGELKVSELAVEFGAVANTLKTLASKGVIEIFNRRRTRGEEGITEESFTPSTKPLLTEGQQKALNVIRSAQGRSCGEVVLLDGVTGSGKTEVYLQAIEGCLSQGLSAIVLVPEISLTPQTVARFRGRFGDTVAVMHSRMGQGERYDQWDRIRAGHAQVVVGARSALFTPLTNLGLIIIDEEHEGSYKQDSAPRYVARDVAAWMVKQHNATLILGSATPAIESLYRCEHLKNWHHVVLPDRVNGREMPPIDVVDMAKVFGSGDRSMFSHRLTKALHETIDAGHKAVLLLNQRGFAKFVLCRECGFVPECPSCSLSLTYHERGAVLVCHHCGYKEQAPSVCPECASPYLKKFGAGTQRVEAELLSVLAGRKVKVVRMDADTTTAKGAHQKLLEEFGSADAAVLLGTQMIAKGLDYDEVTLVGVINADTMLKLPDYRSGERTFALIEQVAGRAGRAHLPGRVIVQSYLADAPAIRFAASYDRSSFLRDELEKRKLLNYPPYVRLANVMIWGKNEQEVQLVAEELASDLKKLLLEKGKEGWSCLSAVPCVLSKLRDTYRYHVVVRVPVGENVSALLLPLFRKRKAHKTVNVAIDIDPDSLL